MNTPELRMDWTINISNVLTVIIMTLAGFGAWYDVKSDVRDLNTIHAGYE